MDHQALLNLAISAAERACAEIMDVYASGEFQAEVKGDNSPLTIADKRAHGVIAEALKVTGLPLLSEEGAAVPYAERKQWKLFWMVDPLDGTKEFLKRNGEFTVNIALIEGTRPVLGVIAVPVSGDLYYAHVGEAAYCRRHGRDMLLPVRGLLDTNRRGLRVVASRSHMNDETQAFVSSLREPELVSKGSSLKFMMLAEGEADIYPRFAPTMEWDTAAADVIVNAVGLRVLRIPGEDPLTYNKESLLNPYFLVR